MVEGYSQILSIIQHTIFLVILGYGIGFIGLILLVIALVKNRYRAEWFFWFLVIYGVIVMGTFPIIGLAFGIFFLVYCLTKRREFLNRE